MRKIVVLSFISLDGVMQAPGGPEEDTSSDFKFGGWTVPYSNESSAELMYKQMSMPFDLLLGRKTYDIFAGYWPKQDPDGPVAKPFNAAKKYVVSRNQQNLEWENSVLVTEDVVKEIRDLKLSDGPMLQVHGSGNMIQTLLANDLVDEMWLKIYPVLLGQGKKLFTDQIIPAGYELTEAKITDSGVIFANYKRAGEVKTGSFV